MSKADAVTSRLTDPKSYTGSHANRFDADGKGRGLAGRADIVEFKGNTNTSVMESTINQSVSKKPVVASPIGAQKFGTQAAKSISCTFFRNGDKHHKGEKITIKSFKTLDQLIDKTSTTVKLPTGAVRKIYAHGSKIAVKSLDELIDGQRYLCCGGEKQAEDSKQPAEWVAA